MTTFLLSVFMTKKLQREVSREMHVSDVLLEIALQLAAFGTVRTLELWGFAALVEAVAPQRMGALVTLVTTHAGKRNCTCTVHFKHQHI